MREGGSIREGKEAAWWLRTLMRVTGKFRNSAAAQLRNVAVAQLLVVVIVVATATEASVQQYATSEAGGCHEGQGQHHCSIF